MRSASRHVVGMRVGVSAWGAHRENELAVVPPTQGGLARLQLRREKALNAIDAGELHG